MLPYRQIVDFYINGMVWLINFSPPQCSKNFIIFFKGTFSKYADIIGHSVLCKSQLKFIYCEKATKFCEIFTLLLSYVVPVKSKVKISQNFVAFFDYMNFIYVP